MALYLITANHILNLGIFHNPNQTALCWVNEEDHCRIISFESEVNVDGSANPDKGNIPKVFQRFGQLSDAIKDAATAAGAKLMWNETLGFLGTCPSNLGTGLRYVCMYTV